MKRIAILLLAAAPACAAREASERPPSGPAPVAPPATPAARDDAPPSIPLRAFTNAPDCKGWPAATEIGVERTSRGAALVFANSDHIGPLRDRVAAMPEAKSPSEAVRLDNVDEGIRLVYEGQDPVSEVHESAKMRARELRRICGLARYIPSEDPTSKKTETSKMAASPPPATPAPSKSSGTKPKADDKKPKPDEKPKAGDKPATNEKPKAGEPAKNGDKPAAPPQPPPPPKPKDPAKPAPPAPPKPGDPKPPPPPKPPESPFPRA